MSELVQTKQVNVTFLYQDEIVSLVQAKISDIRDKIIELCDNQPVISQFPDMVAIIEPSQQINCFVQERKAIISNQDIKDFKERDLEKFLRLVDAFNRTLDAPLSAFGFNYTFYIDFSSNQKVYDKKTKELLNLNKLEIKPEKLLGNGINIAYMENGERVQIISTPLYDKDQKNMKGQEINTNVNFNKNELTNYSNLTKDFKRHHQLLKEKTRDIFTKDDKSGKKTK